ncbi:sulfatase [Aestuariivivens sediminis]|uniref:sulfatase n=1 Tax=Aestuariivivens sediminis TaxID=2913557 RepID=UPI001F58DC30|nr:sulfatase [Aestuariivivens sediminis]
MRLIKLLLFLYFYSASLIVQSQVPDKPNVLFIAIDDLNDWVGCFGGHPQVKTPNLDRLNAQGAMVMSKAQSPATVCGPSRSAILTGKYPSNTGVYRNDINLKNAPKSKRLITLPEYFSKYGYHTLSMGKIFHKHPIPNSKEQDEGQWAFDEWHRHLGGVGPICKNRPVNGLPNLPNENMDSYHSWAFDWGPTVGNDEKKMQDYKTAKWAAEQLLTRDFNGNPFFMAIGFSKPHLQWYVPQKYFDMYPLDDIILPETKEDDLSDILNKYGKQAYTPADSWQRAEKYNRHKEAVQAYLATIAFVDDCIGVLMDGLNASKHANNTIVMLWGDHGWHLGEKQKYGKTQLWIEATRVPLMVKVPGLTQKNKTCEGVVNLIDMYPTLIDLCGLPPNPSNDGRSFANLLQVPDLLWNEPTLTTDRYKAHRIYDGRFSYINVEPTGVEELYDHLSDPMEYNNLISDPKYVDINKRLKGYLPPLNEPEGPKNIK